MTTTRYDRLRAAADELKLQAMKAPGASVERVTCLTLHDQLRADADELEAVEREMRAILIVDKWADRIRGEHPSTSTTADVRDAGPTPLGGRDLKGRTRT